MSEHEFQPDPQSGAGNCTCGAAERHRRHPHMYLHSASRTTARTCGLPPEAEQHFLTIERGAS